MSPPPKTTSSLNWGGGMSFSTLQRLPQAKARDGIDFATTEPAPTSESSPTEMP